MSVLFLVFAGVFTLIGWLNTISGAGVGKTDPGLALARSIFGLVFRVATLVAVYAYTVDR